MSTPNLPPPARLLDLTRSLRRAGAIATGVDRVELAYLRHLLNDPVPLFGLARTAFGYVLLDRTGLRAVLDRLEGHVPWGPADLLSRLPRRRTPDQKQAESDLRRLALARITRGSLAWVLAQHLVPGFDYYNVGHSNLTDRVFAAVKEASGQIHVLIHDVIPLEFPAFQRPGSVVPFETKLKRVSASADRVIYNSQDTRHRAEALLRDMGRVPPAIVAYLGAALPTPDPHKLPAGIPQERPYFVMVSTLEPRKNQTFLLDLWDRLGPGAPPLYLCGQRGWNNDAFFARLDALPEDHPVQEVSGLTDPALAALVQGAAGALFPSLAEGFGLPPLEAAQLGTPVLCNDLPVLREFLGDRAVYADVAEPSLWAETIEEWTKHPPPRHPGEPFVGPTWSDHFKTVLRLN